MVSDGRSMKRFGTVELRLHTFLTSALYVVKSSRSSSDRFKPGTNAPTSPGKKAGGSTHTHTKSRRAL